MGQSLQIRGKFIYDINTKELRLLSDDADAVHIELMACDIASPKYKLHHRDGSVVASMKRVYLAFDNLKDGRLVGAFDETIGRQCQ